MPPTLLRYVRGVENEAVIDKTKLSVYLEMEPSFLQGAVTWSQLSPKCPNDNNNNNNILCWLTVSSGSDVSKPCPQFFSLRSPKWQALSCNICRDEAKQKFSKFWYGISFGFVPEISFQLQSIYWILFEIDNKLYFKGGGSSSSI